MATAMVKAQKGWLPNWKSSLKRVVKPMLRKQKMKVQVRRVLMGDTTRGWTDFLKTSGPE